MALNDFHAHVWALALVLGCTSDKAAPAPGTGDSALDTGTESAVDIDAIRAVALEEMAALDVSAMAVAVLRDGKTVWAEGFGTLTPSGSAPVDADTRFRVASVTKSMTSIAVLQQVEAGCLELSDRISDHMPFDMELQPGMASDMRVEHTLNMTAGLYDVEAQTGQDGDGYIEPFVERMQQVNVLLSPPGRMYNYSNTNSVVAGRLVELCAGDFYRKYMDTSVLAPLGLSRTTFDTATVVSDGNYASGVSLRWEGSEGRDTVLDAESYSASHLWPAMGAWASVTDVARLAEFWMAGEASVLPDSLHTEMVAQQTNREEGFADSGYGYGLKVKSGIDLGGAHYPVRMVSHGGVIFGYTAHAYTVPELGVGVIVLVNRELVTPSRTIELGLELATWVAPTDSSTLPPDPSTYADLTGTYTHDQVMGDFRFAAVDGELHVDIPSFNESGTDYEATLTAVRPDNFELQLNGGVELLSFIRDADGNPEYVRNRYYVGHRVDAALAPKLGPIPDTWRTFSSPESSTRSTALRKASALMP